MSKVMPLSEVKAKLSEVIDEVVTTHERIIITRNGRPAAVLVDVDDLEAIEETISIMTDPGAMDAISAGRAAILSGDVASRADIEQLRDQLRTDST
ncbi:MAG: type II toxin-antitoxin system Phd/YefM family antitoxin [Actinomycetota bacterium]|nr:type II toxin-antitoxin system Phd/YefM family antitoxin [Actinomycetota bacterium]MDK1016919.1 type II toxin-antitoxin system Phd/YefM family antitoxin [Actinomycetota bacterium]MDK1037496.1 type II toxin-antitoxin system Phd/YefM family antitoxin [Actinomycetota bacterium]MDK1095929.1 type II toxin-antitoxin system Phd/YefM family antitoxin [Actinomycetota bacterium]MDK1102069.1 type II toxin-antitoxin system Phd/YefM family antitoxin [Actinomycetota bacterium]